MKEGLVEDQIPQTQVLRRQDRFSAALDLLQECERDWNTAEVGVRANIQIRLEYLTVALQQVLSSFLGQRGNYSTIQYNNFI